MNGDIAYEESKRREDAKDELKWSKCEHEGRPFCQKCGAYVPDLENEKAASEAEARRLEMRGRFHDEFGNFLLYGAPRLGLVGFDRMCRWISEETSRRADEAVLKAVEEILLVNGLHWSDAHLIRDKIAEIRTRIGEGK